jgi:predicted RNA-binding protein YlxR (DUF448 family)
MARKQASKPKRVPQRMCIACRQGAGKRELVRVVRSDSGVKVDPTGKLLGRGAYLHPVRSCWQRAIDQRLLQRSLRTMISAEELAILVAYVASLPDEEVEPVDDSPPN